MMTECAVKNEKHAGMTRVLAYLIEEKNKLIPMMSLLAGLIMGSLSCALYGNGARWSGMVTVYCQNGLLWAFVEMLPVTVGFVAALFAVAPFGGTRLLIGPAICLRAMGIGALLCGVVRADGLRGLCFAALVLLPYAVINALLMAKAGEFALGLRDSLHQETSGLKRSVVRHTLGRLVVYLLAAALSCGLFALSCAGFGKYLL